MNTGLIPTSSKLAGWGWGPPNSNWLFEFVDCSPKITETSSIWMCSNHLANTTFNHKDCVPPLWGHMSIAKRPKLCSHCEFIIQRHPHKWDSEPLAWRRRSLLRNTLHLGRSPPLLQARGSVIKPNLRARCCFLAFAEANDCFPLDATVSPWKHCDEKKQHGKSYWILMLLCFQPCCVWNNNRVWMKWLFVAKGLSPAVTAEQSVAAEMLISHKQRLLSRSNAARPWASLSTCCGENLFNNLFNHCTNSFPDAVDRYFEFQMLASSLGSFFLINEKKEFVPSCLEHQCFGYIQTEYTNNLH